MTYLCFVESEILSVPHMEPLEARTAEEAAAEARDLLRRHASGVAAHVFHGDVRVASVRREELEGVG